MGILSRMRTALKSKGNAAIDRASDPKKELDRAITELEETHQAAMKELLGFKATAKRMEQDVTRLDGEISTWEQRARVAVKKGNDELAKKCLRERKRCEDERASIQRDQQEAQTYAAELNKSRKQAEVRLRMLKTRRGTLATQIASARAGRNTVFGNEAELFEKLDQAEERIDEGVYASEVDSALSQGDLGDDLDQPAGPADLAQAAGDPQADDALAELKAKMGAGRAEKSKK